MQWDKIILKKRWGWKCVFFSVFVQPIQGIFGEKTISLFPLSLDSEVHACQNDRVPGLGLFLCWLTSPSWNLFSSKLCVFRCFSWNNVYQVCITQEAWWYISLSTAACLIRCTEVVGRIQITLYLYNSYLPAPELEKKDVVSHLCF